MEAAHSIASVTKPLLLSQDTEYWNMFRGVKAGVKLGENCLGKAEEARACGVRSTNSEFYVIWSFHPTPFKLPEGKRHI